MTDQAEPGHPPAHDLAAFDLTKRSPEQLAQSFARWKAQRKRPPAAPRAAEPASPDPGAESAADSGAARRHAVAAKRLRSVQYSDRFSELLAAGSEPTVHPTERPPIVIARPSPKRSDSPRRPLRVLTVLAGAASILALAGGGLLELSDRRTSPQAEPVVAQSPAPKVPVAAPIVAAALGRSAVEWRLQRTVDLALMKATPPVRRVPEPATPRVETASKAAAPSASSKPVSLPTFKSAVPETAQFVAKPFVPSVATTPKAVPAASRTAATQAPAAAAMIHAGDPRPDVLFQHGRDQRNGTPDDRVTGNRMASGVGNATTAGSTKDAIDARPAAARPGKAVSVDGDPRGEGSGGARVASETGGETVGGSGAGAEGGNTAANDGGSAPTGGGSMGDANTSDSGTAGNDTDSGDPGSSDAGGTASGGGGDSTGADPGDGESGSSDGEGENSGGIGGAVGGAVGGVGDAPGGALGGDGDPDNNDKESGD
jgi:hypothetical protein